MENEINYNEDLKNLLNQVKKIVWNFVSTNYDIDIQNKVKDALDKLSIKIDNNQKLNEYGEAYCNGSNIYLSEALKSLFNFISISLFPSPPPLLISTFSHCRWSHYYFPISIIISHISILFH